MNEANIKAMEQVRQFPAGTSDVEFSISSKDESYKWIERILIRFGYRSRSKAEKGVLLDFMEEVRRYSRIQIKRLAKQYLETGRIRRRQCTSKGFTRKYTRQDIRLLARTDELHGGLSGPATKKVCERAWEVFGQARYERLAGISVAHLYNLRQTKTYRTIRTHFGKTRSKGSGIGERRKPDTQGKPGCLRVDTVHQGDLNGIKGIYYINAVDEVTRFEIIYSVEKISEHYLIPVLEALIGQFPSVIHQFHTDNGSEYINRRVVDLLNKLLIELTKSRPRHTNDNALVERKNGSIVRKHLGYGHIPRKWAPLINGFLLEYLNPYVNYHRPCLFAQLSENAKGKQRKRYPYNSMMTPYENLKSLPDAEACLNPGYSFQGLDASACSITDNQAAERMNKAKSKLFQTINEPGC